MKLREVGCRSFRLGGRLSGCAVAAAFLVCNIAITALAQQGPKITYINNAHESLMLYFQPKDASHYLKPPLQLSIGSRITLPLNQQYQGQRYIVVRSEDKTDFHLGWFDLDRIANSDSPMIKIDREDLSETKTQEYTAQVPYHEETTDQYGNKRVVTKWRPETRTREVKVTKHQYNLKTVGDHGWETLDSAPSPQQ